MTVKVIRGTVNKSTIIKGPATIGESGPSIVEQAPEVILEKHFYWMPDTLEMYLAALVAIQDFHTWLEKGYANVNERVQFKRMAEITLHEPEPYPFLHPAFVVEGSTKIVNVVKNPMSLELRDFDLSVKFDAKRAYDLVGVSEKHVTQGFGIIVGGDPQKATAKLTNCNPSEPTKDILILPFPDGLQLFKFLQNNKPELTITYCSDVVAIPPDIWACINDYKMVIGVRSGLTYLASCLNKGVIEIYPPDVHRDWLSKWSQPYYQMIYGAPETISAALVYRAVEALWKRLVLHQTLTKVSTPTEPSTSGAESAAK